MRKGKKSSTPDSQLDLFADFRAAAETSVESITAEMLMGSLRDWAAHGWLRRLDVAFAAFVFDMAPSTAPAALMAIAMTAHVEGQGHSCLIIDELLDDAAGLLGWQPEALEALQTLLATLPASASDWRDALSACPAVCFEPQGPEFNQPLVLTGSKMYLRRYWRYEQRIAVQVRERTQRTEHGGEGSLRRWLDLIFPVAKATAQLDWQEIACAIALRSRLSIITGGPGTGKTYTAARLLALLFATATDRGRLRVALCAPTGKAAARLQQSIEGALHGLSAQLGDQLPLDLMFKRIGVATTLHSLLGARPDTRHFKFNASKPLDVDVLVVDETSMVHVEMMASLLEALPAEARIVLLGDKDQLASVDAGSVLGDLCKGSELGGYTTETARYIESATGETIPVELRSESGSELQQCTVMLRHSQRFAGAIGDLAAAVNAGDVDAARALLSNGSDPAVCWLPKSSPAAVVELAVGTPGTLNGYRKYLELLRQGPSARNNSATTDGHGEWARQVLAAFDGFRVLCAVREGDWGVTGMNRAIELALVEQGLVSRRAEWYEGRPVMLTRNDAALGVFNGDVGVVLRAPSSDGKTGGLRAYFADGKSVRSVAVARLGAVETAYAMTVHKSQGSEFEHVVVAMPGTARAVSRELLYTGITRARSRLTIVSAHTQDVFSAIGRPTRRSGGLAELI